MNESTTVWKQLILAHQDCILMFGLSELNIPEWLGWFCGRENAKQDIFKCESFGTFPLQKSFFTLIIWSERAFVVNINLSVAEISP